MYGFLYNFYWDKSGKVRLGYASDNHVRLVWFTGVLSLIMQKYPRKGAVSAGHREYGI